MRVTVRLFAGLRRHLPPEGDGTSLTLEAGEGARVGDVLGQAGLPTEGVRIVLLNGLPVAPEREIRAGDVLSVFPAVGGGR